MIPNDELEKGNYRKVVATKIKGFPNELVIVENDEYKALLDEVRDDLFSEPK